MMLAMQRATEDDPTRAHPSPDRVLFERYRRGERDCFPQLVHAWRACVFGYLTRCGVPASERDDLFQEVFLRVHRAAGRERALEAPSREVASGEVATDAGPPQQGPLVPWVMTITVHVVRSHFRKVGVRRVVTLDERVGEETESASRTPDQELAGRETVAWVERAMLALPLEQREALVLCAIEGMELAEAARALEAPVDTVKTRLRRARVALAEARARVARVEAREESR